MKNTSRINSFYDSVNEFVGIAKSKKLVHLFTDNGSVNGRHIGLKGFSDKLLNFGSCSYMGLEFDERIIESGIEHLKLYGSQFSSSRTYISIAPYQQLEELLGNIFKKPLLLSPNSTLGHLATIPAIIEDNDALIIDHQAHISMHHGIKLIDRNVTIELLRHNRLDELELKIEKLKNRHNRIWYFMDGIYSMYGDVSPATEVIKLLGKHPKLHLYVDDAHGMSWTGENGKGFFLSQIGELHPKMILSTSLAKGFGSSGGVFIFPNEDWLWKVKMWGGPLTYSGPQQPATIGCSIASAKIHLSPEIKLYQDELLQKIKLCNQICDYYKVPLISRDEVPIKFIGVGLPKVGYNLVSKLMNAGYYVNLGIYPAVPETCTGIRFTITNHLSEDDIEGLVKTVSRYLPVSLKEENRNISDVYRAFKSLRISEKLQNSEGKSSTIKIERFSSINEINPVMWDSTVGSQSICSHTFMQLLEKVFKRQLGRTNNWIFKYYLITDNEGVIIAATFFTLTLCKNDMLSPEHISMLVERERQYNPEHQTSMCYMMGSLLTEGDHLFLNKTHHQSKNALNLLLDEIWKDAESHESETIFLRDFQANDQYMNDLLLDSSYVKLKMPNSNILDISHWQNEAGFLDQLPQKKRNRIRKEILNNKDQFNFILNEPIDSKLIEDYYQLYLNVHRKSLKINTFELPFSLIREIASHSSFDRISIYHKTSSRLMAIGFSYVHQNKYYPWILGINYEDSSGVYRQLLYQAILRAKELKCNSIYFGFTADEEKGKLNAKQVPKTGFIQAKDNFQLSELHLIESYSSKTV